jgi:hypothetical protein
MEATLSARNQRTQTERKNCSMLFRGAMLARPL